MIFKVKKTKWWYWRRWFAWYPVVIQDNDCYFIVWLSFVLRRQTEVDWIYGFIERAGVTYYVEK